MSTERKWILVADDEEEIRNLIANFIEINYGDSVKIIEAKDGVEASHKIKFQAFDIIITDLKMPNREGQAFIKSAVQSQLNNAAPIIVITGYPDDSLERQYSHLKQLPKPFEMSDLLQEIERQLKLGRTDRRIAAGVLNSYLEGSKNFVEKVMGFEPEQKVTELKKPGYFNNGSEHIVITFKTENARNQIIIGFERGVVDKIASTLNSDIILDERLICTTAAKTIFRRASSHLWKESNTRPVLIECRYLDMTNKQDSDLLTKCKGIMIPLETPAGTITAIAVWEGQVKKTNQALPKSA